MRKKYLVEISVAAEADIRSARGYIAQDNPSAAERWANEIERLIFRLETMPFAYEVIPEAHEIGTGYRHKLFGSYRVIYRVEKDRVIVLRVIHGARLLDVSMFQ